MTSENNSEVQFDFSGGMDSYLEEHLIAPNAYGDSFNIRTRTGSVYGVAEPEEDTDAPAGLKQGLYGYGPYLVLFNKGIAYYKDVTAFSPTWTRIDDFYLSPTASRIHAQAVPASVLNVGRVLIASNQTLGDPSNPAIYINNLTINGTAAGLVCQDGINQPFLISSAGIATRLQSYAEWLQSNRQYVPIGTCMAYMNGILFVANGSKIYRSVSGRPLDFVVNVTITGEKGGDATTTEYSVGGNSITCLYPLRTGELLVGTADGMFPIDFDYTSTIFAEPTFKNNKGFAAGITNAHSIADLLTDYAFIDSDGIRSIEAILTQKEEGRNCNFSRTINNILGNRRQLTDTTCTFVYDNYVFFAVNSTYGYVVLVYDLLSKKWTSIDSYGIGAIKQFAVVKQESNPKLYCITDSDVYELFSASSYLQSTLRTRALISGSASIELKTTNVRTVFTGADSVTEVVATLYNDGRKGRSITKELRDSTGPVYYPATYPVTYLAASPLENVNFNFGLQSKIAWKTAVELSWTNAAKLAAIQFDVEGQTNETSVNRASKQYAS